MLGGGLVALPQLGSGIEPLARRLGAKLPEAESFSLCKQLIFAFPQRYCGNTTSGHESIVKRPSYRLPKLGGGFPKFGKVLPKR